ncbi:Tyrosine-protein phosphatase [Eumeta japonica]|uniref:Tyrosine-protein phosphatase n=1 Tax=Eumeta variegata TaxID=151549 RepID=A0A4C1ZQP9_EUMVA|nr:Tyrosine-protein phosphatase [Eumeta japonica]
MHLRCTSPLPVVETNSKLSRFIVSISIPVSFSTPIPVILDSDIVLTIVFDPNPILNFGSGHAFDSDPGPVPDSAIRPAINHSSDTEAGDKLVGVHCTHGLNRTGYLVCRYMRDRLDVPPKQAITQFEKARGYHIERENYIADLLGKSPPPPSLGPDTDIKPIINDEVCRKTKQRAIEHNKNPKKEEIRGHRTSNVIENWRLKDADDTFLSNTNADNNIEHRNRRVENWRVKNTNDIESHTYKQYTYREVYKTSSTGYIRQEKVKDRTGSSSSETGRTWLSKRSKSRNSTSNPEFSSPRDSDDSYSFIYDY